MSILQKYLFASIASLAFAASASAQVVASAAWVRATVPAMKSSGAFMQLTSAQDARLVGVSSPVAERGEIHQMAMKGDMMKMEEVDGIDLPAGKTVNLSSGGYHLMLVGLKRQLKDGENIPLALSIQTKSGKKEVLNLTVPVKPLSFVSPQSSSGAHH